MSSPHVFRSLEEADGRFGPCALAIGNFDGVHLGHQALIAATRQFANRSGLVPSILTFDPHPTAVVAPQRTPHMICSLEQRIQLLRSYGIERVLVLPFDRELAAMSPREFVAQILCQALETRAVVVGENFLFGHKQAGNTSVLRDLGEEFGFQTQFLAPVTVRGEVVSSSAIRRYVSQGNVSRAARLLGRCFSLTGPVVSGHGVGSKQTVPTLNLRPVSGQVLPLGVFITETNELSSNRKWPSITNVGTRPTFQGDELTIETFLLASLEGSSPEEIEIDFRRFVRPERQFSNPQDLRSQIMKDVARAQAYWRRAGSLRKPAAPIY